MPSRSMRPGMTPGRCRASARLEAVVGYSSLTRSRTLRCFASQRQDQAPGSDGLSPSYWRRSAQVVSEEMLQCFQVVERVGPGVVYLGSSRTPESHPHFQMAKQLSHDVALLLGSVPAWSGIGGGMMDAATQGAVEAGASAAGFKIYREGGKWVGLDGSWEHPYLPRDHYVTCEFFSARKHGLAEAASRRSAEDRTAVVVLPGGTGTLDEVFEIIVLMQLDKLGVDHAVPVLVMNYDGFYSRLLDFLNETVEYGALGKEELSSLFTVCDTNEEAIEHLKAFYGTVQQ